MEGKNLRGMKTIRYFCTCQTQSCLFTFLQPEILRISEKNRVFLAFQTRPEPACSTAPTITAAQTLRYNIPNLLLYLSPHRYKHQPRVRPAITTATEPPLPSPLKPTCYTTSPFRVTTHERTQSFHFHPYAHQASSLHS